MKRNVFKFLIFFFVSTLVFGSGFLVAEAQSSFTKQINYQARVSPAGLDGSVLDTDYDVTFKLYTQSTGGTAIWTETWDTSTSQVSTSNGVFSVLLGEHTPLDSVNFNQPLYLGVNFDNDGEFTPRREIGAIPTAFETDKLDGLDSAQFLRSDTPDTLTSSSSDTALTVDQQGSGNALEVTSSSTSYLLVDNSGNVGVGDATPDQKFTVGPNSEFQVNDTGAITGITGLSGATGTYDFSGATLNVSTSTIDDVDEIDPSLRSGADTTLITGTPGAAGDRAQFNEDGDLVRFGDVTFPDAFYDWESRQKITIDATQVDADLSDFPVYLDLSNMQSGFFSGVASDGSDIRVTQSDAETQVAREVVAIDRVAQTGELHFKADLLSATTDTEFYVYYGNPGASEPAPGSTFGSENVWSNNFEAVYHMNENPSEVAPQILDSTANNNDGSVNGAMTGSDQVAGQVGGGLDFDGSDDFILDGDAENYINGLTAFSVSTWIESDSTGVDAGFIETANSTDDDNLGIRYDSEGLSGGGTNVIKAGLNVDGTSFVYESASNVQTTNWQYVLQQWESGSEIELFLDGMQDSPTEPSGVINGALTGATGFYIGSGSQGVWDGRQDEVRVSSVTRSPSWISAEHTNQNTPATFAVASAEEGGAQGDAAGINGQIQYNDGGSFGGASAFTFDNLTGNIGIGTFAPTERLSLTGGDFEQTITSDPVQVGTISSTDLNEAQSVTVSDSYAYVASSNADSLTVLDVSDPTNPTQVGTISNTDIDGAISVTVSGSYAYVASSQADSLTIIDISDPTNPVQVGTISNSKLRFAFSVTVSGSYAYVVSHGSDSLTIIDISDPTNPTQVGTISNANLTDTRSVTVSGSYAYATGGFDTDVLSVIDISDPTNPVQVGAVSSADIDFAWSVTTQGSYAYVVSRNTDTLTIFDISDPTNPTQVGVISNVDLDSARSVTVAGSYAYVVRSNRLTIIDISDPTNPTQVGVTTSFDISGARSVTVVGSYAYVASYFADSLTIFRLPGTRVPTLEAGTAEISQLDVSQNAQISGALSVGSGLSVGGSILTQNDLSATGAGSIGTSLKVGYSATTTNQATVTDPSPFATLSLTGGDFEQTIASDPVQVGGNEFNSDIIRPFSVVTSGSYAYVASETNDSLTIFDISDPENPTQVSTISDSNNLEGARSVTVAGSYAYVAAPFADALTIIDISDPTTPTQVGTISNTDLDSAESVTVVGSYAYVASQVADSLTILDISDPTTPTQVGTISNIDLEGAYSVTTQGSYAYVASQTADSLTIIDISDPTNPTQVGTITSTDLEDARSVTVSGSYAYVASSRADSLTIIDISNPATPTQVGTISNTDLDDPRSVTVSGSYAYVASFRGGSLTIIDISDPANPTQVGVVGGFVDAYSVSVSGSYAYMTNGSSITGSLTVFRLPGTRVPTLEAGTAKISQLGISQNADVSGFLSVGTGLSVGGSIFSQGGLGVSGTSSFRSSVNIGTSTTIFSENTNIPSRSLVIGNGTLCVDDGGENCNDAARNPGTIYANNVNVQSVDLAEQYPTLDEDLEAGDIVMLDPKNPVFIERFDYEGSDTPEADQATLEAGSEATTTDMNFRDERDEDESSATSTGVFSPRLLGVVSTKPGFLLGGFADEDFETRDATGTAPALRKVPLALSGRVPVKVSTANGDIEAGDRIAPSSQPGVGMKAFPDSPQTLGIALESFTGDTDDTDDETATIIVFIDNDYRTLSDTLTQTAGLTGSGAQITSLRGTTDTWSLSEDGELVVEELRVRGKVGLQEFTLFDKENGKPYCVKVVERNVEVLSGTCESRHSSLMEPVGEQEQDEENSETPTAEGAQQQNATSTGTSTEEQ